MADLYDSLSLRTIVNGREGRQRCLRAGAEIESSITSAEYETAQNALNQVSLWDGIIPSKEHAKFLIHTTNKYRFTDQGSNLRGKEFNLTLHWHVMPKTGKMFADKIVISGFRLPNEYR